MLFRGRFWGAYRFAGALLASSSLLVAGDPASAAEGVPKRIVSLAPSITETTFALGEGARLVGVTAYCDWPPEARALPRVGSYLQPNVEVVVSRRPDLAIVVPSPGNHDAVRALEDLGIEILVVAEGPGLGDVFHSIETIGRRLDRAPEAARLVESMQARVSALRAGLAGRPPVSVLLVVDHAPLVVVGEATLLDELLTIAGGRNVARKLGPWPRVSVEFLVREDPEVILDGAAMNPARRGAEFYAGLGLRAARAGRIRTIAVDEVMRPGPRIVDGVEALARILHDEGLE